MKDENMKLIAAVTLGAAAGLVLGMYLWGAEENKRKLSVPVEKIVQLIKNLEAKDALTVENITQAISELFDKTEKIKENKENG